MLKIYHKQMRKVVLFQLQRPEGVSEKNAWLYTKKNIGSIYSLQGTKELLLKKNLSVSLNQLSSTLLIHNIKH